MGDYNGPVKVLPGGGTKLELTPGSGSAAGGSMGGMVSVLAGTGSGQYRRLVHIAKGASGGGDVVTLDRPFETPLDETSIVQLGPFKGRFIFDENRYEDCGAFQLYANAADVIVSKHHFARAEGLLSWGRATGGHVYAPNIRVQFVDNVVEEGNHMWNWNATYPYPHPKTIEPYSIGILGSDQDPQPCEPFPHGAKGCKMGNGTAFQGAINHLVVIKRNTIENNGGIEVRGHTTNVLVEGNAVRNSSVGAPARTALVCARRPLTRGWCQACTSTRRRRRTSSSATTTCSSAEVQTAEASPARRLRMNAPSSAPRYPTPSPCCRPPAVHVFPNRPKLGAMLQLYGLF